MTPISRLRGRRWFRPAVLTLAMVPAIGLVVAASVDPAGAAPVPTAAAAAAAGAPAAAHTGGGPRPTIVLVHGAFADSSSWNQDVAALQRRGFPVIAASNPLRGLTSDSDYVRSILATISGPIVLVGHSYGGAVITNAARGVPNVRALVFIAAFLPDTGEAIGTMLDPERFPGSQITPAVLDIRPAPNAAAPGGQDADVYIKPANFRAVFAQDVPVATTNLMAAGQRPLANFANTEPSGDPAWRTIPSWALVSLDDRTISPAGERFMAQRAHAHLSSVHASHAVMVSHPAAVLATILAAVRGTA
jgi:pimeloyl-ACP methyl ester carboxylesterase